MYGSQSRSLDYSSYYLSQNQFSVTSVWLGTHYTVHTHIYVYIWVQLYWTVWEPSQFVKSRVECWPHSSDNCENRKLRRNFIFEEKTTPLSPPKRQHPCSHIFSLPEAKLVLYCVSFRFCVGLNTKTFFLHTDKKCLITILSTFCLEWRWCRPWKSWKCWHGNNWTSSTHAASLH